MYVFTYVGTGIDSVVPCNMAVRQIGMNLQTDANLRRLEHTVMIVSSLLTVKV